MTDDESKKLERDDSELVRLFELTDSARLTLYVMFHWCPDLISEASVKQVAEVLDEFAEAMYARVPSRET